MRKHYIDVASERPMFLKQDDITVLETWSFFFVSDEVFFNGGDESNRDLRVTITFV